MKKVFKILFIAAFLVMLFSIGNKAHANSIDKISMDIYIDSNGNATITEVWECDVNKGTEVYHPYYNLGTSKIYDLTVSENGKTYEAMSSWSTAGNLNTKAYKSGINEIENGVELCWGISEYGSHTYTVKYRISNFVVTLKDSQMVYWTFIPYDFSEPIGEVYIKISSFYEFPKTTDVWGYGNYGGTCYVYDGYIEMESPGELSTYEYMTILAKFPKDAFNTRNAINQSFDYYYQMAQEGSTLYNSGTSNRPSFFDVVLSIIIMIVNLIIPIGIIGFSGYYAKKSKEILSPKDTKLPSKVDYYRDIPCRDDLQKAYFIANQYNITNTKTDILGAIILKWLKESLIKIEQKNKGKIFKTEDTVIILSDTNPELISDHYEQKLFKMLLEASKDGILENNEFKKWCQKSYSTILKWFDMITTNQKNKLIKEGLIIEEEKKILGIKTKKYRPTDDLNQIALQLAGLKRYLLEYTLVPDREAMEVHLLEDYLIYAQMFGIAKKVTKQFKKLYPDIIEQSNFSSYENIYFIHVYSTKGITSATNAQANARAASYSGGGGGFSSGGGGGGSFGGGGGRSEVSVKKYYI